MARKKKLTPIEDQYMQQRRRVQNLIAKYRKKRGISFDSEDVVGPMPRKISREDIEQLTGIRSVSDIERIANRDVHNPRETIDSMLDRVDISYEEGTTQPSETDVTLFNFEEQFQGIGEDAHNMIMDWYNKVIEVYGRDAVAEAIEQSELNGNLWERTNHYYHSRTVAYLQEIEIWLPLNDPAEDDDITSDLAAIFDKYDYDWTVGFKR